ncbi:probable F-box protein At1g44080 [Mercurialis annua]|uniref:probable F-box protein At1g44080 n=1 Tax=Mercurialis annua TaxID=3986 RepID=UPI00215F9CDE|nr:probable F-box protein At1g44080 [Mercurialis annua]
MKKMVPNWSDLDSDLLSEIADRISCLRDFIIFGVVCKSWRSVASPEKLNKLTKVPWLLLDKDDDDHNPRKFLSLSNDVIYRISLPKPRENRFNLGNYMFHSGIKENQYILSSKGWYLMVEDNFQLSLLNPFSLSRIDLPHCFPSPHIRKFYLRYSEIFDFALSFGPSATSEFTIMIVYFIRSAFEAKLVFWKNGDREWTNLDLKMKTINAKITYHNGRFYIPHVDFLKGFVVHEIDIRNSKSVSISSKSITNPDPSLLPNRFWIVESSRVLMMVYQRLNSESRDGRGYIIGDRYCHVSHLYFVVQEIDFEKGELKEVSDLGDEAIFLGCYSSFLVDVSNESRFKSNHIYFAENFRGTWTYHNRGVGVYSMIDGSSKPLFSEANNGYCCSSQWIEPRP